MQTSAAAPQASRVEVCGRLNTLRPATASERGSISLGARTFVIASGSTRADEGRLIGTGVCLSSIPNSAGELEQHAVFGLGLTPLPAPPGSLCGFINRFEPATPAGPGVLVVGGDTQGGVTLVVPQGSTVTAQIGSQRCVEVALDSSGDAIAVRLRDPVPAQPGGQPAPGASTKLPATNTPWELPGLLAVGIPLLLVLALFMRLVPRFRRLVGSSGRND